MADTLRAALLRAISELPRDRGNDEWDTVVRGDVLAAIDTVLAASPSLDVAWAEAEAALPKGHVLAELRRFDDGTAWGASTDNTTGVGRYHWSGDGPTPAAALLALAEHLRASTMKEGE